MWKQDSSSVRGHKSRNSVVFLFSKYKDLHIVYNKRSVL